MKSAATVPGDEVKLTTWIRVQIVEKVVRVVGCGSPHLSCSLDANNDLLEQAVQQLHSKSTPQQLAVPTAPITHSAPMDIFQRLVMDLDTEGRYLFLNAVANQLRYPNNHTHYFSCVLLFLFAEAQLVWITPGWFISMKCLSSTISLLDRCRCIRSRGVTESKMARMRPFDNDRNSLNKDSLPTDLLL